MADEKYNFDNKFSRTLNWASLIIIVVCLSGLVWIISYLTLHEFKPIKNSVIITTNISKNDNTTRVALDTYIKKVDNRISKLQSTESDLNKKIDEINTFYKFLGTILAIVIAIAGFFGFKSLHELKIRNLENAKEVAKNEANAKAESEINNLKESIKGAVELAKSEAKNQTLSEFYEIQTKIDVLSNNISDILNRLDNVDKIEDGYEDLSLRVDDIEKSMLEKKLIPTLTNKKKESVIPRNRKNTTSFDSKEEKKNIVSETFGEEGFENEIAK